MLFEYPGLHHHRPGVCELKTLTIQNGVWVFMATEINENSGASITNCIEKISRKLRDDYGPHLLFEHYSIGNTDTYDFVEFLDPDKIASPKWFHIGKSMEDVSKFLIENLEPVVSHATFKILGNGKEKTVSNECVPVATYGELIEWFPNAKIDLTYAHRASTTHESPAYLDVNDRLDPVIVVGEQIVWVSDNHGIEGV